MTISVDQFLYSFGSRLDPHYRNWVRTHTTMSEAWQKCENANVMLTMLGAIAHKNYNTSLLIFAGNLINFVIEKIANEVIKSIAREVSSMFVMAVLKNKKEMMQSDMTINTRCRNVLRKRISYVDNCIVHIFSTLSQQIIKNDSIVVAITATILFETIEHDESNTIANELRQLIGNPFEEVRDKVHESIRETQDHRRVNIRSFKRT